MHRQAALQAKVADLEAALESASAERAALLERQRSAAKPPRPPGGSGGQSPTRAASGAAAAAGPFGRPGGLESQLAGASLQIASLEVQVRALPGCPLHQQLPS